MKKQIFLSLPLIINIFSAYAMEVKKSEVLQKQEEDPKKIRFNQKKAEFLEIFNKLKLHEKPLTESLKQSQLPREELILNCEKAFLLAAGLKAANQHAFFAKEKKSKNSLYSRTKELYKAYKSIDPLNKAKQLGLIDEDLSDSEKTEKNEYTLFKEKIEKIEKNKNTAKVVDSCIGEAKKANEQITEKLLIIAARKNQLSEEQNNLEQLRNENIKNIDWYQKEIKITDKINRLLRKKAHIMLRSTEKKVKEIDLSIQEKASELLENKKKATAVEGNELCSLQLKIKDTEEEIAKLEKESSEQKKLLQEMKSKKERAKTGQSRLTQGLTSLTSLLWSSPSSRSYSSSDDSDVEIPEISLNDNDAEGFEALTDE